jgi:hypothetical protein
MAATYFSGIEDAVSIDITYLVMRTASGGRAVKE